MKIAVLRVRLRKLISIWLDFNTPVNRKNYIFSGLGLMGFKYLVEASFLYSLTGNVLTPLQFLSPLLSTRQKIYAESLDQYMLFTIAFWSLPFLWIGISMSIRRAINAGKSPWIGFFFLFPGLNYLLILFLSITTSSEKKIFSKESPPKSKDLHPAAYVLFALVFGVFVTLIMSTISILFLGSYGTMLFFTTPTVIGAIVGYQFNRMREKSLNETAILALLSIVFGALSLLLFALEGLICIWLATPIAALAAFIGAVIGRSIAIYKPHYQNNLFACVAILPALTLIEAQFQEPALYEVISDIKIHAPAEKVWGNVIGFSEIPDPPALVLQSGIAYPLRARIDGQGVGAIRYCEFTTGAFVEPITVWDPPKRLAFDVSEHPPAMHEWSPLSDLHPPHLDGYFQSKKGEFRLVSVENGTTRLEGSTYYELKIFPQIYWKFWSDYIVHKIHSRVLTHIKNLSES